MSEDESAPLPIAPPDAPGSPPQPRPRYKSWRKKYRKVKARFDEVMKQNSVAFKDEQKLEGLARRLREQNDQILDLLLDLNSSLAIPPEQRYNVKYREDWADQQHLDFDGANNMLANAYEMDQQGRLSQSHFWQMKASMEAHVSALEAERLDSLEARIPHPRFLEGDAANLDPASFLTIAHEEEYLNKLDTKLGDPISATAETPTIQPWSSMSAREIEREVELRNPLSVHNWLKKHVTGFADDDKSDVDGPGNKKPLARSMAKRMHDRAAAQDREGDSPSSTAGGRHDADNMDDELGLDDAPAKSRKSRGADDAYRPKTGVGSRGGRMKRKREDGDSRSGTKKPKASIGDISDV